MDLTDQRILTSTAPSSQEFSGFYLTVEQLENWLIHKLPISQPIGNCPDSNYDLTKIENVAEDVAEVINDAASSKKYRGLIYVDPSGGKDARSVFYPALVTQEVYEEIVSRLANS